MVTAALSIDADAIYRNEKLVLEGDFKRCCLEWMADVDGEQAWASQQLTPPPEKFLKHLKL